MLKDNGQQKSLILDTGKRQSPWRMNFGESSNTWRWKMVMIIGVIGSLRMFFRIGMANETWLVIPDQ